MSSQRKDDQAPNRESVLRNFLEAGKLALEQGRTAEAVQTLRAALELADQTPGQDALKLMILEQLVLGTRASFGAEAALPLQKRVVAMREAPDQAHHLPTALALLAILYDEMERPREAGACVERAVKLVEALDETLPMTLAVAGAMAEALRHRGMHLDAAEQLMKKTVRGLILVLGEEDVEVAAARVGLACVMNQLDRGEEAGALLKEAIEVLATEDKPREALGEGLMVLAQLRAQAEAYEEAEGLFTRAEATYRSLLGPEAPEVLGCRFQRGAVYREQGKFAEAEALFREALEGLDESDESERAAIANVAESYADLLKTLGRKEEAKVLRERAKAMRGSGD